MSALLFADSILTESYVIASFITGGISLLVALLSLITNKFNDKRIRDNFYSETVSEARIKWIEKARDNVVDMSTTIEANRGKSFAELSDEDRRVVEQKRVDLLVHITPMEKIKEYNDAYLAALAKARKGKGAPVAAPQGLDSLDWLLYAPHSLWDEDVDAFQAQERLDKIRALEMYRNDALLNAYLTQGYAFLRDHIQEIGEAVCAICKDEWNRIKAEAGGNEKLENDIYRYQRSVLKQKIKISEKEAKSQSKGQ